MKKKRLLKVILQATNGEVVRLRIVIAIDRRVGVIQVPSPRIGRTRSVDGRRPVVRVVATIVARASAGAVASKGEPKFVFETIWIGGSPSETIRRIGSIGDETFPSYTVSRQFLTSATSESGFKRIPFGVSREVVPGFTRTSGIICGYTGSETGVCRHRIPLIKCSVDIVRLSGEVISFGHGGDGFPSWRSGTGHGTSGIVITTRLPIRDGGRSDGGVASCPDL